MCAVTLFFIFSISVILVVLLRIKTESLHPFVIFRTTFPFLIVDVAD